MDSSGAVSSTPLQKNLRYISTFLKDLIDIMDGRESVIMGDFNLCFLSENNHPIFKFLKECDFQQLVEYPSHMKGRMIDLVFTDIDMNFKISQQSPFFTDHDVIKVSSGKLNI